MEIFEIYNMQGTIANNSLTPTPLHTHIMDLERGKFP